MIDFNAFKQGSFTIVCDTTVCTDSDTTSLANEQGVGVHFVEETGTWYTANEISNFVDSIQDDLIAGHMDEERALYILESHVDLQDV